MAFKMTDSQISAKELRAIYQQGTVRQRYRIAVSRIDNPHLGPSVLVNTVSALEGFARCVAVRQRISAGEDAEKVYTDLKFVGPVELLRDHVCVRFGVDPALAFGNDAWCQIDEAVEFRNLLVHEATYLHGGTCRRLIAATRHCLQCIARLAGAE